MKNFTKALVLLTMGLAACTVENGGTGANRNLELAIIPQAVDPCGAGSVQFLVGRPESALQGRRYAAPLRLLRDGDVIDAKDVNLNRLTVAISGGGRIASLKCG